MYRIPGYLSDIYNDVFKPLRTSRSDFLTLIQDSKVIGIGKEESLFCEGDAMVHDPRYLNELCLHLVSKNMN